MQRSWGNWSFFNGADLYGTNFANTTLDEVDFIGASMVNTIVAGARFQGCRVWGASIWGLDGQPAVQKDFIITPRDQSDVSIDDLGLAQFVYLLLNNNGVRTFIDTVTSKAVLILGRFTPERKVVLDAIRERL